MNKLLTVVSAGRLYLELKPPPPTHNEGYSWGGTWVADCTSDHTLKKRVKVLQSACSSSEI